MVIEPDVRQQGRLSGARNNPSIMRGYSINGISSVAVFVLILICVVGICSEQPLRSSSAGALSNSFVFVKGGSLPDIGNGMISVSPFYISKYPVTRAEWQEIFAQRDQYGYSFAKHEYTIAATNHPVINVNWYDCIKWCNLRSEIEGKQPVYQANGAVYRHGNVNDIFVDSEACGYRLPTDAEWEFAARGGVYSEGYAYSGSDVLSDVGWYDGNSIGAEFDLGNGRGTWPVGLKHPNELGLHDMSGNVWEWCFDWHPDYVGLLRVRRGGTWKHFAAYCRVEFRYKNGPKFGSPTIGFRLARNGGGPRVIQKAPIKTGRR